MGCAQTRAIIQLAPGAAVLRNVFITVVVLLVVTLITLIQCNYPDTQPSDYLLVFMLVVYQSLSVLMSRVVAIATLPEGLAAYMVFLLLSTPITALATALFGPVWRWRTFLKIGFLAPTGFALMALIGGERFWESYLPLTYVATLLLGALSLRFRREDLVAALDEGTEE